MTSGDGSCTSRRLRLRLSRRCCATCSASTRSKSPQLALRRRLFCATRSRCEWTSSHPNQRPTCFVAPSLLMTTSLAHHRRFGCVYVTLGMLPWPPPWTFNYSPCHFFLFRSNCCTLFFCRLHVSFDSMSAPLMRQEYSAIASPSNSNLAVPHSPRTPSVTSASDYTERGSPESPRMCRSPSPYFVSPTLWRRARDVLTNCCLELAVGQCKTRSRHY